MGSVSFEARISQGQDVLQFCSRNKVWRLTDHGQGPLGPGSGTVVTAVWASKDHITLTWNYFIVFWIMFMTVSPAQSCTDEYHKNIIANSN